MTLDPNRLLGILEGKITDYTDEELDEAEKRSLEIIPGHEIHAFKPGRHERESFVAPTHAAKVHEAMHLDE